MPRPGAIALERRAQVAILVALALGAVSCGRGDSVAGPRDAPNSGRPPAPVPAIVSNPVASASAPGQGLTAATELEIAYVSLAPGTVSAGRMATVRNARNGSTVTTVVVEGGFDPVGIAAQTDDTLHVQVRDVGGTVSAESYVPVPRRRRPVVVRTDPPPKKRDVALNASIVIVFSEPIDPGTLTTASVRLLRNVAPVPASIALKAGTSATAELIPGSAFEPNTTYELSVLTSIRDLDGDSLEAPLTVTFTTAALLEGQIAFASTREGTAHIWVVRPDGSGLTRLTNDVLSDSSPAWSADGSRIAFVRGGSIWVMNADGSDAARLTAGASDYAPAWSPDGTRIVFSRSVAQYSRQIYLMNADGSGVTELTGGMYDDEPSWSPDGRLIAFDRTIDMNGDWFTQVYVMNADGSGATRLTSPSSPGQSAEGGARWSPDGSAIAFWSYFAGVATIASGSDTPETVYLCFNSGCSPAAVFDARPDWSPDGRALVFTGHGPDGTGLYIIDRATTVWRKLVPAPSGSSDFHPAWSRTSE